MATVLMTGATGLIGSRVVSSWNARDGDLATVGRQDFDLLAPGALASYVDQAMPAVFLHLAWTASGRVGYRDAIDNLAWDVVTREVAQVCTDRGVRFIGTGTALDDQPATDAYTRAKSQLRQALADDLAAGRATWLRPYYVFDPDGDRPGVLRAARDAAASGETLILRHPHAVHDFVHVDDVARAVHATVVNRLAGVVDIGSGRPHRVAELVSRAGFEWKPGSEDDVVVHDSRNADTTALRSTGWVPIDTERFFGHDRFT